MSRDSSELESRIETLTKRLQDVERRLARVEGLAPESAVPGGGLAEAVPVAPVTEPREPAPERSRWFSAEALPRYGRTLVAFGGAFLLRAVTESEVLPQLAGTGLGILYALLWVVMIDRAAAVGRLRSATFHGLAATGIAFPLIWEATAKFESLSPPYGAAVLAVVAGLTLFVVGRRRLGGLAWIVTLAAGATLLALAFSTKMWSLFVFELALLALVAIWLSYDREWRAPAWIASTLLMCTMLLMTSMVLLASPDRVWELFSPDMLLAIQLAWVVIFFGTLGYRKLSATEDLSAGEVLLGLATLGSGFGGAVVVARATWVSHTLLGAVSLALAAGFYGVAFAIADQRLGRRVSFVFYSTAALFVTLVASSSLFGGPALAITFSAAGLLTAWLGARKERATLSLHAAVYVTAAAWTSGLLGNALDAFVGSSVPEAEWIAPYVMVVLVVAAVFLWLPVAASGKTWGRFSRAPMLVVIGVLLFGLGAVAVTLAGTLVPTDDSARDPAVLAALRTGVLAAIAVLLACLGRSPRWPEASLLLYPTLALGGIKLLFDDVPNGRPVTLFFSLVLYGAALIFAPRLARRRSLGGG